MWAGIAALVIAGLMLRAKKWDKAIVAFILLGAGLVGKFAGNPVTGWNPQFIKAVAVIGLAALVIDYWTKKIERLTYLLAFALPFFALACDGAIGNVANALYGSPFLTSALDHIA